MPRWIRGQCFRLRLDGSSWASHDLLWCVGRFVRLHLLDSRHHRCVLVAATGAKTRGTNLPGVFSKKVENTCGLPGVCIGRIARSGIWYCRGDHGRCVRVFTSPGDVGAYRDADSDGMADSSIDSGVGRGDAPFWNEETGMGRRFSFLARDLGLVPLPLIGLAIKLFVSDVVTVEDAIRQGLHDSPFRISWAFVLSAVLAPICEEVIFRDFLFGGTTDRWGPKMASIGTTAIFALLHFYSRQGFVAVFCYGLVFSGSIVAAALSGPVSSRTRSSIF